jgi:hypothetical protein
LSVLVYCWLLYWKQDAESGNFGRKNNSKSTFFFKTWRLETQKHSFSAFLKENSPPKNKQHTHETGDLRTISNVKFFATCDARQSPFICLLLRPCPLHPKHSAILQHKIQGEKKIYGKLLDSLTLPHPTQEEQTKDL